MVPRPFSPSPGVVVTPAPNGHPTIVITPTAGVKPGAKPGSKPGPRPGSKPGGGPVSAGPKHKNEPPKKKETEKKFGGSKAVVVAGTIFGAATEGLDLLDAAWDALPQNGGWNTKIKGTKTSPAQKAKDIANAFDDPDFDGAGFLIDFAKNAAKNEAKDIAIGKGLGTKDVNKALGKAGMPTGPGNFGVGFGGGLTGGGNAPKGATTPDNIPWF